MSLPHFMMVVDDDEIEIANQDREHLQRFDFDSTSSSFIILAPKLNCNKKNCKSSYLIIIIVVAYLQILYYISISLTYGKDTIDSADELYNEYLP